jgi:hypothetical protein
VTQLNGWPSLLSVLEVVQWAPSLITDEEELREIIAGTRPGP